MQQLNPLICPLTGVQLIEASAGTGKTYTITSLYLRLILGLGYRALLPDEILVVTFTNAATDELRGRIRKRLRQAEMFFQQQQNNAVAQIKDDFLTSLLAHITDLPTAIARLRDAQLLMDNAAIYTIHGFCQRVLKQYAFESGLSFDNQFVLSDDELTALAVRDVWRQHVYPLQGVQLNAVLQRWPEPAALHSPMVRLLGRPGLQILAPTEDVVLEQKEAALKQAHAQLSELPDLTASLAVLFNELPASNGNYLRFLPGRLQALDMVLADVMALARKNNTNTCADNIEAFTPGKIDGSVKKGGVPPQHPAFILLEQLLDCWRAFEKAQKTWAMQFFVQLLDHVQQRLIHLKQQDNVLSSADLLTSLATVLNSAGGADLAAQLRQQFPLALVDEFQDTDAEQYQIFSQIYAAQAGNGLFMIGDPKQAIYKFRGADINTYLRAAADAQQGYTLDTNFRSTQAMVDACNWLFSRQQDPFLVTDAAGVVRIAYQQVQAGNQQVQPLVVNGSENTALQWLQVKYPGKDKTVARIHMAERCAAHLTHLLNQQSFIGEQRLQAGHIAVLVRSRVEAALMQQALNKRHIRAVFLSSDSVLHSAEAQAIYQLLLAILNNSETAFKNALAAPVWSYSLAQLHDMCSQEREWEKMLQLLTELQHTWLKKGLMAMLMAFLHQTARPACWLNEDQGERKLTNILHIAELLQETSQQVHGREGLLAWFARQINQQSEHDQAQLRLESEQNLVQIITLHRSKGLQYPVVYMPFTCVWSDPKDTIYFDTNRQQLVADLYSDKIPVQAIHEARAEDLRIFYVGITRAESACFIGIADHERINDVALGHLLPCDGQSLSQYLMAQQESFMALSECPAEIGEETYQGDTTAPHGLLVARDYKRRMEKYWRLGSFSGLSHGAHNSTVFTARNDGNLAEITNSMVAEATLNRFNFPRGSHVGNALHSIFEELDFTAGSSETNLQVIRQQLLSAGLIAQDTLTDGLFEVCRDWLLDCLHTPLTPSGIQLAHITAQKKLVEMEFYFPVNELQAPALNALLTEYAFVSDAPALDFQTLHGMMKGFIDLIFFADGQYFVLDYKSNYLGSDVSYYQQEHMARAMADNRYDFQLVLYTLALHRYLRHRVQNYAYDTHIGGGLYLFLRGMSAKDVNTQGSAGVFLHKPARELIEKLDALIEGKSYVS